MTVDPNTGSVTQSGTITDPSGTPSQVSVTVAQGDGPPTASGTGALPQGSTWTTTVDNTGTQVNIDTPGENSCSLSFPTGENNTSNLGGVFGNGTYSSDSGSSGTISSSATDTTATVTDDTGTDAGTVAVDNSTGDATGTQNGVNTDLGNVTNVPGNLSEGPSPSPSPSPEGPGPSPAPEGPGPSPSPTPEGTGAFAITESPRGLHRKVLITFAYSGRAGGLAHRASTGGTGAWPIARTQPIA